MLKLLPLVLFPAFVALIVYWLTGRRAVAVVAGGIALGLMLFIGITE